MAGALLVCGLALVFGFSAYRVDGPSMEPSLEDGGYIIVEKFSYLLHPPERGDVVVFSERQERSSDYIKRVIGLPGDRIEVIDDHLFLNQNLLPEPYLATETVALFSPRTLGKDEYFALGDNRPLSRDSRNFGPVTRHDIMGRAWIVYIPSRGLRLAPHHSFSPRPEQRPKATAH